MEASHGKEEKRQESGKEKEKEESSKKRGQEETSPKESEAQKKSGQESCHQTGSSDGGIGGDGAFHGGNARRGENRPQPRSRLALSDGFQALSGLRMNCGQSGGRSCPGLNRGHSTAGEEAGWDNSLSSMDISRLDWG